MLGGALWGCLLGGRISCGGECGNGKSQAVGHCALTPLVQKPSLLQTSASSPNLPAPKTLPIKWDDNCVLLNCTHGPGGAACCPKVRKIISSYTLIKTLSPHSAKELLKFVARSIMLSICSRKQERRRL